MDGGAGAIKAKPPKHVTHASTTVSDAQQALKKVGVVVASSEESTFTAGAAARGQAVVPNHHGSWTNTSRLAGSSSSRWCCCCRCFAGSSGHHTHLGQCWQGVLEVMACLQWQEGLVQLCCRNLCTWCCCCCCCFSPGRELQWRQQRHCRSRHLYRLNPRAHSDGLQLQLTSSKQSGSLLLLLLLLLVWIRQCSQLSS
jgi:hypothetical protein